MYVANSRLPALSHTFVPYLVIQPQRDGHIAIS